ncbi:MAG TPA: cyclic nucleotide-binding domain-containing protein [Anaerolineales bacterium]|nr:cyclic nucleotide-binding domain-containing protein [Anaerolineales bacterium]
MPTAAEIAEQLKEAPLFSGLSRPQLRALAGLVKEMECRVGRVLCRQGEPGRRYFIVVEGALRVTRVDAAGRVLAVRQLQPGDGFGETSLLLGDVRDATVECIRDSRLLYIEREDFDRVLEADPRIERRLRMRPDVAERRRYPRFAWLEEGELPVKVLRKHPAVLLPGLVVPGFLLFLLLLGGILASSRWGTTALAVGLALALVPLGFCGYLIINWRDDIYVVTNRRVVHRERTKLVQEQISAVPLQAIQDVQQLRVGIAARIWEFGDLIIETAGGMGQVVFRGIPSPASVQEAIFVQRERMQAMTRAAERAAIQEIMRRHFFGEEEEEAREPRPPAPLAQPRRMRGCLLLPFRLFSYLSGWHQEGATVTWRKHWIALLRSLGLPILIFILITAVVLVTAAAGQLLQQIWPLYALAIFIILPWALYQFEDWQNDLYQVTATRVVHVEQLPLLLREERREASLEQITNVRSEQSFWGRLLGYGDVIVETAAPAGTFHFRMVSRPQEVQAEVFAHIDAARRRRQEQEAERHRAELLDWFSVYDEIQRAMPSGQEETD